MVRINGQNNGEKVAEISCTIQGIKICLNYDLGNTAIVENKIQRNYCEQRIDLWR